MADVEVLLTGFEPFGSHEVNPSWEVMKTFDGQVIGGCKVASRLLPVVYSAVSTQVPELYKEYPNLKLTIHCGVGREGQLKLETLARNTSYRHKDNDQTFPSDNLCVQGACDQYNSKLQLDQVLQKIKEAHPSMAVDLSTDAGLYLCEYTYFTSLHYGYCPSLFLHVPPFNKPYTVEQLQAHVRAVIENVVLHGGIKETETARPKVGLAVFVKHANHPGQVLLGKRLTRHADGNKTGLHTYAAPGGHLEFGETFSAGAKREVMEECGVVLRNVVIGPTLNVVRPEQDYHYVVVCCIGTITEEPINAEPSKCGGWEWHTWAEELPQPTFPSLIEAKTMQFNPFD